MANPNHPTSKSNRCTGHCCSGFALEHSYEGFQADYQLWLRNPNHSKIPQIDTIAPMLIPLHSSPKNSEYVYACRNLSQKGDCLIYESRPQFCRDFPDKEGCHFWNCTSSASAYAGLSFFEKLKAHWRWLRSLRKPSPS